jgi:hypothetical protein
MADFSNVPSAEVNRHAITSTTLDDIVQSVLDEVSDYRDGAFRGIGALPAIRTERVAEAAPQRCRGKAR